MSAVDRTGKSSRRATSHAAVRDLVAQLGPATAATIRTELAVSEITAWRYLNELVQRGELDREWVSGERAWVYALPGQAPEPDARVVDCAHKQARHQHGTRLAYVLDGCRCTPCREAQRAAAEVRNRARAYRRPTTTWVDAAPVRAHVERLQAAGLGHKRIALVAGVTPSSVGRLLYGRRRQDGRQEPPARRINPDAARRMLAVPMPDVDQLGATVNVDGTGTRRRLQALVALGWSQNRLAPQLGMTAANFSKTMRSDRVQAQHAVAVRELYDRLSLTLPEAASGYEAAGIERSRARARELGWAPPLAWDDENLDDPAAEPFGGDVDEDLVDERAVEHVVTEGLRLRLTGATLHAAVHALAAAGHQPAAIAERLDIHVRQAERLRGRAEPPRRRKAVA